MTISNIGQNDTPREFSEVPGQTRRREVVDDVQTELEDAIHKIRKRASEVERDDERIHITLSTERKERS
jgi:hypothetical protein